MGIHLQSKHKYRNVSGNSNIKYHDFNNGDALIFKDKYAALLQLKFQTLTGAYMTPSQPKFIKILRNGC